MNIKEFNPFEDVLVCPECGKDDFSVLNVSRTEKSIYTAACAHCKMRFLAESYTEWPNDFEVSRRVRARGVKVNSNDDSWGILFCEGKEPEWRWMRGGQPPKTRKASMANKEIQERWIAHLVAEKMMESQ
jgi:transcription elongation factor Elf1